MGFIGFLEYAAPFLDNHLVKGAIAIGIAGALSAAAGAIVETRRGNYENAATAAALGVSDAAITILGIYSHTEERKKAGRLKVI